MKKKTKVKVENHERYIITYADLLTLLLAFFVILYAMSTPDPVKYEELGGYFENVFPSRVETVSIVDNPRINEPRTKGEKLNDSQEKMMKSVSEQNNLRKLKKDIDFKIDELGLEKEVSTSLIGEGLSIVLTNDVLFKSGSSEVKSKKSKVILKSISSLIEDFPNKVKVSGHTDNVPVGTSKYRNNWELSSFRAISVLQELMDYNANLVPERFSATGYGEFVPIESNDTSIGKSKNRRVEIIILRNNDEGLLKPTKGGN